MEHKLLDTDFASCEQESRVGGMQSKIYISAFFIESDIYQIASLKQVYVCDFLIE